MAEDVTDLDWVHIAAQEIRSQRVTEQMRVHLPANLSFATQQAQ
jgi:hypothetical protein